MQGWSGAQMGARTDRGVTRIEGLRPVMFREPGAKDSANEERSFAYVFLA